MRQVHLILLNAIDSDGKNQLSDVYAELRGFWWESLSAAERKTYKKIRVNHSGRTSDLPTPTAPYDFGISEDWWNKSSPDYPMIADTWYLWGDPEGFGSKRADRLADVNELDNENGPDENGDRPNDENLNATDDENLNVFDDGNKTN
jgi:hypothetical protein